jgi:hypothetical protein
MFWVRDSVLGFRIWDLRLKVQLEFGLSGLGFGVKGLGFGVCVWY